MKVWDVVAGLKRPQEISEAPFGADVRILVEALVKRGGAGCFIARDERQALSVAALARFFRPDLELLLFPGWDCLPYDRVSPSAQSAAQRCATLARLAHRHGDAPLMVVATASAMVQRAAPRSALAKASFAAAVNADVDQKSLQSYLEINGYSRTDIVREPGEYAIRGGIIDIFPPDNTEPVRLDFFGQTLDTLRSFDPETQRSTGNLKTISLAPVSEIFFDDDALTMFRRGYMENFGPPAGDPMFEAVKVRIRRQGLEHWLPLFHDKLETLFDYLGPDALIGTTTAAHAAARERLELVRDYHGARMHAGGGDVQHAKVLPPTALYLSEDEFEERLSSGASIRFHPYEMPEAKDQLFGGTSPARDFAVERANPDVNVFDAVVAYGRAQMEKKRKLVIAAWSAGSKDRLATMLSDHGLDDIMPVENWEQARNSPGPVISATPIESGFESDDLAILAEQDILGDKLARPRKKRKTANFIAEISSLSPGDLVVHVDHGIGRYEGLRTVEFGDAAHDCLELVYAGGDKVLVPVENIELVTRFGAGSENALDKLGGGGWQTRKARAKRDILEMAEDLIRIAAERELRKAEKTARPDGLFDEFCARFPYEETDDQLNAIDDAISDLGSGKPMDRLVCGDVGFGKTEVALRTAFIAAMQGMQVAIIAPTTLLARQHFKTFSSRFEGWPIEVRHLSRFVSTKDANKTREMITNGTCDVVVGTHALLSKQVNFKRLGLLVVDEEQRFGVKHKERLKELKADVHVLTLSATPIPRTLQLALTGIRDLSIIATPPIDRLSVRTYVMEFDNVSIREALLRERYRGGQAYYIAPRVSDLPFLERFLKEEVPEVSFLTAHGQMPSNQLEDIMTKFYEGQADVLLSTTIVESGIDIPRANTMIIHRADMFGLAQLYQLRGRVGRAKLRAYAYLTTKKDMLLTDAAEKRLKVLQSLDSLGAGFMLASHDLDMRGGGNLLGDSQSGHVREVGVELYQQMLEDAVKALRTGDSEPMDDWSPSIDLGAAVLIPEGYVENLTERLSLYRRLADLETEEERGSFAAELIDRFGPLPQETRQLLEITAIKQACKTAGVSKLAAGPRGATLAFREDAPLDPQKLVAFVNVNSSRIKLKPDRKLVITGIWPDPQQRLKAVKALMKELSGVLVEPTDG
ncbi:MAG: transcription-repair coupling factor [Hirschia sp.]|nr:transcription-repair coupling factor [Hirschia sp.]MBF20007.1 transcription-repair coupling factor [Hirschia sp.]